MKNLIVADYFCAYLELVGYVLAGRSKQVDVILGQNYYYATIGGEKYYLHTIVPGVSSEQILPFQVNQAIDNLASKLGTNQAIPQPVYQRLLENLRFYAASDWLWSGLDPQYFGLFSDVVTNRDAYLSVIGDLIALGRCITTSLELTLENEYLENMLSGLASGLTETYVNLSGDNYYYIELNGNKYWLDPNTPDGSGNTVPKDATVAQLIATSFRQFVSAGYLSGFLDPVMGNYFQYDIFQGLAEFLYAGGNNLREIWVLADPRRVSNGTQVNQAVTNGLTYYLLLLACFSALFSRRAIVHAEVLFYRGLPLFDAELF